MSGAEIQHLCQNTKRLLLKIDAEGAEPIVVRTLQSIIVSSLPEIVIEVLPSAAHDLNEMDCFRLYRLFQLTTDGPVERHEFTSGFDRGRDYALVPRQPRFETAIVGGFRSQRAVEHVSSS